MTPKEFAQQYVMHWITLRMDNESFIKLSPEQQASIAWGLAKEGFLFAQAIEEEAQRFEEPQCSNP